MVSSSNLRKLREELSPSETHGGNNTINKKTSEISEAIATILRIIAVKDPDVKELEETLGVISTFFRLSGFSAVILPVLIALSEKDREKWVSAQCGAQKVINQEFEQLPKSVQEDREKRIPAVRERELMLLKIYGITSEVIGAAFIQGRKR